MKLKTPEEEKYYNDIVNEYPVQVTRWFHSPVPLEEWASFLEAKGYRTTVAIINYSYRDMERKTCSLYRTMSKEEEDGIRDGKYYLADHFLCYSPKYFDEGQGKLSKKVSVKCMRCGNTFTGYNLEGHNLCPYCKTLELAKEDTNAGYNC